ncbi:hypothetical protein C4Y54_026030 [Klebsiella pneumoniae subsp. pneumoniae]|nr:hypothetical protein C4Y54_026030 [Klebsiella pneumoniae subsp. pneumoniae]
MLKKTALSCAASPFAAVPQRDCHQQPSSHNPHNPNSPHHKHTPNQTNPHHQKKTHQPPPEV